MNALDVITQAARSTGYREEAIFRDFAFPDVLDPNAPTRHVSLAAFTRTPPSYRCAAFAAVPGDSEETAKLVAAHRALGAPLLFVLHRETVSLWQVRGDAPRQLHQGMPFEQVPALFEEHRREWNPDAIHRAKSIGVVDKSHQLDFVDVGLLPAVEGEIHAKLDRVLVDVLDATRRPRTEEQLDPHLLFRVVFRLLAAKVLHDRRHEDAGSWDTDDPVRILRSIESYYSLPSVLTPGQAVLPALTAAWDSLCSGISFSNISSDDLAFVYENTLVTKDTRKQFGTHSTPRQLAEYAVGRLGLHDLPRDELRIYEPFAGAGMFLVSALRHVRDLLSADWNDAQRHEFLVERLSGDEIDAFACEVAALSLILADYPNRNGWRISESDLFVAGALQERLASSNVVLCNPPFEDFTSKERSDYGLSPTQYSKPVEVLEAVLAAQPHALAFVLPRGFILQSKFRRQRQKLEKLYRDVELVELPDRLFHASDIETSLVVAKDPRPEAGHASTLLRSTVVSGDDCATFLKTGRLTISRATERSFSGTPSGDLWIPALEKVWEYLASSALLGDFLTVHRGVEWQSGHQEGAWAPERRPGYRPGLHSARHNAQYVVPPSVWLDCREDRLRGNALEWRWNEPKLIANAARLRRGSWCIGAALDTDGLICSQQYFGFWPKESSGNASLQTFAALLNAPLANAFLAVHSPKDRMRIATVKQVPMPTTFPETLTRLVDEYVGLLDEGTLAPEREGILDALLLKIDAAVLQAYDLPPRLERELLSYFPTEGRPVAHHWQHWNGPDAIPGLTLAERVANRYERDVSISEVFAPLPSEEATALRTYWP